MPSLLVVESKSMNKFPIEHFNSICFSERAQIWHHSCLVRTSSHCSSTCRERGGISLFLYSIAIMKWNVLHSPKKEIHILHNEYHVLDPNQVFMRSLPQEWVIYREWVSPSLTGVCTRRPRVIKCKPGFLENPSCARIAILTIPCDMLYSLARFPALSFHYFVALAFVQKQSRFLGVVRYCQEQVILANANNYGCFQTKLQVEPRYDSTERRREGFYH